MHVYVCSLLLPKTNNLHFYGGLTNACICNYGDPHENISTTNQLIQLQVNIGSLIMKEHRFYPRDQNEDKFSFFE